MKAKIYTVVMVAIALAVVPAVVVTAEEEMVTSTYKFEVLDIEEGAVVLKSIPDGKVSTATPPAEREVTIDGKVMNWDKTPIGTILTATVSYVPTEDMIQQVSGKMLHKVNRTVVVLLDTGEVKQFTVEPDFTFTVDGQPRTIDKLTPNTKLTATSIKADPAAVITPDTPITGEAPK